MATANNEIRKTPHSILIGIGTLLLFDNPIVPSTTKSHNASINSSIAAPLLHFYDSMLQGKNIGIAKK